MAMLSHKDCRKVRGAFMLSARGFVQQAPESRSPPRDASAAVLHEDSQVALPALP